MAKTGLTYKQLPCFRIEQNFFPSQFSPEELLLSISDSLKQIEPIDMIVTTEVFLKPKFCALH